jgi:cysteinyl-tRNA synthetase
LKKFCHRIIVTDRKLLSNTLLQQHKSMTLTLTNSLSKLKEEFIPLDQSHVKMYVCGPTVYDRPHLGNARSAVVYDILFRVLQHWYPRVTYVRNITDVDDKIIDAANRQNITIDAITSQYTDYYHQDISALNCLSPTIEPRAVQHIESMITLITHLLANKCAYEANGHVLFDTKNYPQYGELSKRSLDDMIAGARVEVAPFKKNPTDFVLWKPAKPNEEHCSFNSPWGLGRPGWHIECSAMSYEYLGHSFDIHGGGADLMFPHHENEIAQTKCAFTDAAFARYWVHNGFLTINGEKMSKSLTNFKTVFELLEEGVGGAVIRYFYLTAHYRKPLDFNSKSLSDSAKAVEKFSSIVEKFCDTDDRHSSNGDLSNEFIMALSDDLNTPKALSHLHSLVIEASSGNIRAARQLRDCCAFLGLDINQSEIKEKSIDPQVIEIAEQRVLAKKEKRWQDADLLRAEIQRLGYDIVDTADGYELHERK